MRYTPIQSAIGKQTRIDQQWNELRLKNHAKQYSIKALNKQLIWPWISFIPIIVNRIIYLLGLATTDSLNQSEKVAFNNQLEFAHLGIGSLKNSQINKPKIHAVQQTVNEKKPSRFNVQYNKLTLLKMRNVTRLYECRWM